MPFVCIHVCVIVGGVVGTWTLTYWIARDNSSCLPINGMTTIDSLLFWRMAKKLTYRNSINKLTASNDDEIGRTITKTEANVYTGCTLSL